MGFGKSPNAAEEHVTDKKVCCSRGKYLPKIDINRIEIIKLLPVVRRRKIRHLIDCLTPTGRYRWFNLMKI